MSVLPGGGGSNLASDLALIESTNNTQTKQINNLQSEIKSLASGSPLVANSISEMTDKARVYVNISDGYWYYHNGSSWIQGGIYQSTFLADESVDASKLATENYIKLVWNQGTLGWGNEVGNSEYRIYTDYNYVKKGSKIIIPEGYDLYYYECKLPIQGQVETNVIASSPNDDWVKNPKEYIVQNDCWFRFMISNSGKKILPTEGDKVISYLIEKDYQRFNQYPMMPKRRWNTTFLTADDNYGAFYNKFIVKGGTHITNIWNVYRDYNQTRIAVSLMDINCNQLETPYFFINTVYTIPSDDDYYVIGITLRTSDGTVDYQSLVESSKMIYADNELIPIDEFNLHGNDLFQQRVKILGVADDIGYFESSSNNDLYINLEDNMEICIRYSSNLIDKNYQWKVIKEKVGITESPNGMQGILLKHHESLVFNCQENDFKIISTYDMTLNDIPLFQNSNGRVIGGQLKNYYDGTHALFTQYNRMRILYDNVSDLTGIYESDGSNGLYISYNKPWFNLYSRYGHLGYSTTDWLYSWQQIAEKLGNKTSPSGKQNCVYIPHNQTLVYDYNDNSFKVVYSVNITMRQYPIIMVSLGKIIDGVLLPIYEKDMILKEVDTKISDIDTSEKIPTYFEKQMSTKLNTIHQRDLEIGNHGDSFMFITDIHWNTNAKHSPILMKYIIENSRVNKVFFGGDIANTSGTEIENYLPEVLPGLATFKKYNIIPYVAIGNHDTNDNMETGEYILDESQLYSLFMEQNNKNLNTYFYKDNENMKIRYIVLNDSINKYWDNKQIEWLKERITELSNDWHVLVFAHRLYEPKTAATGVIPTVGSYGQKIIDALDAVYDNGATIAGLICGHVHRDMNMVSSKGYPCITTACDAYTTGQTTFWGGYEMALGTDTEQCFDVIHIDTNARKLYFTRIGVGENREFSY